MLTRSSTRENRTVRDVVGKNLFGYFSVQRFDLHSLPSFSPFAAAASGSSRNSTNRCTISSSAGTAALDTVFRQNASQPRIFAGSCEKANVSPTDFPRMPVEGNLDCFFLRYGRLHDVYKQTCICARYCKPFFEVMYTLKILDFIGVYGWITQ